MAYYPNLYPVDPEWAWIKKIRKGDVLQSGSGIFRIVRGVKHNGPSLGKTSVDFTIQHCSWTGRCYTVLTGCDLKSNGYRPVKAKPFALRTEFDRAVEAEIINRPPFDKCKLTCCDVVGIA